MKLVKLRLCTLPWTSPPASIEVGKSFKMPSLPGTRRDQLRRTRPELTTATVPSIGCIDNLAINNIDGSTQFGMPYMAQTMRYSSRCPANQLSTRPRSVPHLRALSTRSLSTEIRMYSLTRDHTGQFMVQVTTDHMSSLTLPRQIRVTRT